MLFLQDTPTHRSQTLLKGLGYGRIDIIATPPIHHTAYGVFARALLLAETSDRSTSTAA